MEAGRELEATPSHCWHDGNQGFTQGDDRAGQWEVFCCHCGLHGHRTWKLVSEESEDHGPWYKVEKRVSKYPEGLCAALGAVK